MELDTGQWTLDIGWEQRAEIEGWTLGCWMLDDGYLILSIVYWILDICTFRAYGVFLTLSVRLRGELVTENLIYSTFCTRFTVWYVAVLMPDFRFLLYIVRYSVLFSFCS